MQWFIVAVLAAAFLFALFRGAGISGPGQIDFGWVAIALLIFVMVLLPAVWQLRGLT